MYPQSRTIAFDDHSISSLWHRPDAWQAGGDAVIVAHGAGNDMHSAFVTTFAEGMAAAGRLAVRFNFPYKERGGKAPDRAPLLEATWRAVLAAVREDSGQTPGRIFLAGKSMGGRIASHLAADGEACAGLIFLGYPLHPARRPEKIRAEHLPRIRCPMLFLEGTRDPLCDLDLLRPIIASLSAPITLHVVEGGDHSFHLLKRYGRSDEEVMQELVETSVRWMDHLP